MSEAGIRTTVLKPTYTRSACVCALSTLFYI